MPTFQFILHTSEIRFQFEGDDDPVIGFYSVRRARGKTPDDAFQTLMHDFDSDAKLTDLVQSGHDAGLRPKTEIDEVSRIPWWESLLPWKQPGLIFYDNDEED